MGYPPNPLRNFALCKKKNRRVPNQSFQPQKIFKFYNKKRDNYTASNIRASFYFSDTEVF